MNLLETEIDMIYQYLFGIMLGDVRVSAPSLYQQGGGGGVGRPLYLNYYGYYEGGSGSGGGGDGALRRLDRPDPAEGPRSGRGPLQAYRPGRNLAHHPGAGPLLAGAGGGGDRRH